MMKLFDMNKLILDLYVDATMAGSSLSRAREERDQLLEEVADLYAELEHESYEREQFQVELNKANKEAEGLRHSVQLKNAEIKRLNERVEELLKEIVSMEPTDPDEEVPDHHDAFDSMFPGCTPDDLPFPDVEDLAPASEVMGGDE